jgi:hypothetical protein
MKAVSLEKLLPSDVPPGERILWHGRPRWISLARRAYRADFVAAYFVALTVWSVWSSIGAGFEAAARSTMTTLGLAAAALAILALLSYLSARTTLYVVTSKRLVLKVGIALPVFINVPFKEIGSAAVRAHSDGTGEVTVGLVKGKRIGYWLLWPSARPLHLLNPQPCLRCVANAALVADTLAAALVEASGQVSAATPREAAHKAPADELALAGRAAA